MIYRTDYGEHVCPACKEQHCTVGTCTALGVRHAADRPLFCDTCGVFLYNDLNPDGESYIRTHWRALPRNVVNFYCDVLDELPTRMDVP